MQLDRLIQIVFLLLSAFLIFWYFRPETCLYFQVSGLASSLVGNFVITNVLFGWQVICMANDYCL